MMEDSEGKEATYGVQDNEVAEGEMPNKEEGSGAVKIPEDFQKQVTSLIDSCNDKACLDFIMSEASKKQSEMMKSEDKGFSAAEMPE